MEDLQCKLAHLVLGSVLVYIRGLVELSGDEPFGLFLHFHGRRFVFRGGRHRLVSAGTGGWVRLPPLYASLPQLHVSVRGAVHH